VEQSAHLYCCRRNSAKRCSNTEFDKAIEGYKAEQGKEIERLREQLNHTSDRGRRSNEHEFAAIREVWEKTTKAFSATGNCVANVVEYPDLNQLSDPDLEAYFSTTDLSKIQVDQILQATDHNDMFRKVTAWRSIAIAGQENFEVNLLLRERRVFMPDSIRSEFQGVIDLLDAAQIERKLQLQHPYIPRNEWGGKVKMFFQEGNGAFDRLALANNRLFRNET
jgi:hypothetical protein